MKKEVKQFLQEEMEKGKERLRAEVEQDETLQDVEVPEEIEERLFDQIHSYEEERRAKEEAEKGAEAFEMSAEEAELIRLGRLYRRRRRLGKYIVLAAVLVMMLAIGMTSLGGPEKVIRMITEAVNGGGSRVKMNTDDGNVDVVEIADESDAFQEIESQWNIKPVRMNYLPEGVMFQKAESDSISQVAYLFYQKDDEVKIYYQMAVGYLAGSLVAESEEDNQESCTKMVGEIPVTVTRHPVEDDETTRWCVKFKWQNAQYLIWIMDEDLEEVNKIVENLIFL